MTKTKKTKKEAKIINDEKESPVDFIAVKDKDNETWQSKTLEVESKTKLQDDMGDGQVVSLRFFEYMANPKMFAQKVPTSQEIFNSHIKQIEFELWKDGWKMFTDTPPRLMMAKDKSHYRIVIAAIPAKGRLLSMYEVPKTLSELASHGNTTKNS